MALFTASPGVAEEDWQSIAKALKAKDDDAQILFWTPEEDLKTALETITERCQLAFTGVPNETRKSLPNGITYFERVLPGPDRMYPDTDSAPISVTDEQIEAARKLLPIDLAERLDQLSAWNAPKDTYTYILRNNLMPVIESMAAEFSVSPAYIVKLYAHVLKSVQGRDPLPFGHDRIADMFRYMQKRKLAFDILPDLVRFLYKNPNMIFSSILAAVGYKQCDPQEIHDQIPILHQMFLKLKRKGKRRETAETDWIMGRLRKPALGNIPLAELRKTVDSFIQKEASHA